MKGRETNPAKKRIRKQTLTGRKDKKAEKEAESPESQSDATGPITLDNSISCWQVSARTNRFQNTDMGFCVHWPKSSAHRFIFPGKEDIEYVDFINIVCKLSNPTSLSGTNRAATQFKIDHDLIQHF